jgi:outer membrane protein
MQAALKKHSQLQKSEALAASSQARVTQARSGQQPSLSLQGVASRGPTGAPAFGPLNNPGLNGVPPLGVQGMAGDPVKKQFGGGLNLSQNLYDDGRTRLLVASRTNAALALEADTDTQRAQILLAVQQSYFAVLRAQRLDTIQKENLRQREATATQAKAFAESGIKSEVDSLLAVANVAEAKGLLAGTGNDIQASFAQLNNAMGETNLTAYLLEASPILPLPETLEKALALAQSQRPELKGLALQRRSADEAAASLRRELRLRVDGIASLGAVNPGTLIRNNQNLGVAVAITLPLSTGGAVEGRITEEERRRDAYAAQQREALETVKLQVTRVWLDVQTREAQLVATKAQIEAVSAALQLAQERYRLQLSTLVELTDAEAQVLKAKLALVNADEALALARATLSWATGTTLTKETAR